jgi:hypothetical protein
VLYHAEAFRKYLKGHRLIDTRSVADGQRLELSFLVKPRRSADLMAFSRALAAHPSIERANVIICDDEGLAQNVF